MKNRLSQLRKRREARSSEALCRPPRASDLILLLVAILLVIGAIARLLVDFLSAA